MQSEQVRGRPNKPSGERQSDGAGRCLLASRPVLRPRRPGPVSLPAGRSVQAHLDSAQVAVAYKGDAFAVGRPRRDVDRALSAVDVRYRLRLTSARGHQSNVDVFVERMIVRLYFFGE